MHHLAQILKDNILSRGDAAGRPLGEAECRRVDDRRAAGRGARASQVAVGAGAVDAGVVGQGGAVGADAAEVQLVGRSAERERAGDGGRHRVSRLPCCTFLLVNEWTGLEVWRASLQGHISETRDARFYLYRSRVEPPSMPGPPSSHCRPGAYTESRPLMMPISTRGQPSAAHHSAFSSS